MVLESVLEVTFGSVSGSVLEVAFGSVSGSVLEVASVVVSAASSVMVSPGFVGCFRMFLISIATKTAGYSNVDRGKGHGPKGAG